MAGRYYTGPQKAQAVALARVIGAESAGAQLGIDWRTVRRWSEKAGDRPDETVDPGTWKALMDLALARVTADVASGKLPSTAVATIAGIAARNAHRDPKPEPAAPRTEAEAFVDQFEAWALQARPDLLEHYGTPERAAMGVICAMFAAERMREWEREMSRG